MITQKHVCDMYGPLPGGSRLSTKVADFVGKVIMSAMPDITAPAARVMAQHLHALRKVNNLKLAKEALVNLARDFGRELFPVGTLDQSPGMAEMASVAEGGGSLEDFLDMAKGVLKDLGRVGIHYGKKAAAKAISEMPGIARKAADFVSTKAAPLQAAALHAARRAGENLTKQAQWHGYGSLGGAKDELEAIACDMARGGFSLRDIQEVISSIVDKPGVGKALEYAKWARDSPLASMGYNLASDAVGRKIGITKDFNLEGATEQFYKTRERRAKEKERELRELARERKEEERDLMRELKEQEKERKERERELRAQMKEAERELREQELHLAKIGRLAENDEPPLRPGAWEQPKKRSSRSPRGGNVVGGNVVGGNVIGGKKPSRRDAGGRFLPGAVLKSNLYDAFKA